MSLQENGADLQRHAVDIARRTDFTYKVLVDGDAIGACTSTPSTRADYDVDARSLVRADNVVLDGPLATGVADWLARGWPLGRINGRSS